ncbi:MAG TPA: hypothetical protein VHP14_01385 [Anaerolineales bacterium]|nr:hypothetical protein [Anaerolineales bacterium]
MFEGTIWLWIGFNLFVLVMLALDLGGISSQGSQNLDQGSRHLERRLDYAGNGFQCRTLLLLGQPVTGKQLYKW